jgi:hypothetical protein
MQIIMTVNNQHFAEDGSYARRSAVMQNKVYGSQVYQSKVVLGVLRVYSCISTGVSAFEGDGQTHWDFLFGSNLDGKGLLVVSWLAVPSCLALLSSWLSVLEFISSSIFWGVQLGRVKEGRRIVRGWETLKITYINGLRSLERRDGNRVFGCRWASLIVRAESNYIRA